MAAARHPFVSRRCLPVLEKAPRTTAVESAEVDRWFSPGLSGIGVARQASPSPAPISTTVGDLVDDSPRVPAPLLAHPGGGRAGGAAGIQRLIPARSNLRFVDAVA